MAMNISRFFIIAVCLLTLSLTIFLPSPSISSGVGVKADAWCQESEFLNGTTYATRLKSNAWVKSYTFNDMGDYNTGWYDCLAELNGGSDQDTRYYSGGTTGSAQVSQIYNDSPENVSGNGSANAYIYGVGCVAHDYESSSFN